MSTAFAGYCYTMPHSAGLNEYARLYENIKIRLQEPAIWHPLKEIEDELNILYKETSQDNWDGYDACAISYEALTEAIKFIRLLHSASFPIPEIAPEPSGEIGFEWHTGKRMVFATSVGGKHIINYAGIFGDFKTHGTINFGETLPHVIIVNLCRLFNKRQAH
ncbi:MAG: hypothetical protein HZA78_08535 [Candidatus Schekmanbacteria bacterium]|nr:hypothetical protein [Candidatus Schekmanbacteria bacterium]